MNEGWGSEKRIGSIRMGPGEEYIPRIPLAARLFAGIRRRGQLVVVGVATGIAAGLAAVLLRWALESFEHVSVPVGWIGRVLEVVMPAAGALLAVSFLKYAIMDSAGHGVPEVIAAVTRKGGKIRFRSAVSRLVGSFLTIASGGSAGPEAPVVLSGSALGSNLASAFWAPDRVRITAVGCGAAGAIAGIFNAPVAGMLFSVEVILGDWVAGELLAVGLSAAVGAEASRMVYGEGALFHTSIASFGLADLLTSPFLGMYLALVSILFVRTMERLSSWFKLVGNPLVRAALGGIMVGLLILLVPEVKGEGYALVQTCIDSRLDAATWIVMVALLGKVLATSMTLGSGGVGGVFAPCLVMGSLSGILFGRLISTVMPSAGFADQGAYALLGMTGLLSGVLQAPLTGIFLIAEVTGGYSAIVQLIIVGMIASLATRAVEGRSIYESGIGGASGQIPRPRTDERILSEIDVMEVLERDCLKVPPEMTIREFLGIVQKSTRNYFIVEDSNSGAFMGLVRLESVRHFLLEPGLQDTVLVEELMETRLPVFGPDADLVEILSTMEKTGAWSVPVVENGRFLGLVSRATLLDHYRRELIAQSQSP